MVRQRDKRKSKRATVLKPTRIRLKGRVFAVSDISNDGIGIVLDDDGPAFSIGERLAEIPIPSKKGAVNVQGVVSHISVTAAGRMCGIQFVFSGAEYDAVMQFKRDRCQNPETREAK